jgi:hypothetical protein
MNVTTALLDFLMDLLRNPDAAAKFAADPEEALEKAGLGGVTCDHVDTVMPVVLDYAPVIGDRNYDTGGNTTHGGDAGNGGGHNGGGHNGGGHNGGGHNGGGHNGGGHNGDHAHAVQQIEYVVKNYSYTSTDDRDTITDQSVNQNIWANGDVTQLFDNDSVVASGDHAVAAGDDAWVDNSTDNSVDVDVDVDVDGDFNVGSTVDSNNDNSDNSTNTAVIDSEDVAVGSTNSANDFELEVELENVGNDYSDNSDNSVNDSFKQDNDTIIKEDNDVVIKDNTVTQEDNDVIVKDNTVTVEDNDVIIKEDNDLIVKNNEFEYEYEYEDNDGLDLDGVEAPPAAYAADAAVTP